MALAAAEVMAAAAWAVAGSVQAMVEAVALVEVAAACALH